MLTIYNFLSVFIFYVLAHGAHGAYSSLLSEFLQIPASAVDLLQEFVELEAPVETQCAFTVNVFRRD